MLFVEFLHYLPSVNKLGPITFPQMNCKEYKISLVICRFTLHWHQYGFYFHYKSSDLKYKTIQTFIVIILHIYCHFYICSLSHLHVASKILKSARHNMKFILVNCHVVMSINLIFFEKCENWVNWKQQNKMKTLWPKFDFHRIYSFQITDDSDKIWRFSKTDHTHFSAH